MLIKETNVYQEKMLEKIQKRDCKRCMTGRHENRTVPSLYILQRAVLGMAKNDVTDADLLRGL